jgi:glycosyltransferase involved in cell wall biosynthesis
MTPLLIVSDAPTAGTGLGRITSDLASRIAFNLKDVYDVATCGYGGINARGRNHHHYTCEGMAGWIIPNLQEIWEDWAGRRKGVILFISDPSRLGWFSRPEISEELTPFPSLKKFLTAPPFQKWVYSPVDAAGPNDRLSYPLTQSLLGFDRILAYGKFGQDVIRRTLGEEESAKRNLMALPHGIDTQVFYPRERKAARAFFFSFTGACTLFGKKDLLQADEMLIGIVATNQFRKDYGLAIETAAILSQTHKIRLWIHSDRMERETGWSIPSLLSDFGLLDRTVISLGKISDEAMAKAYSACDVTIAPGAEGFGYPIAESLACGTPVVATSYAGGANIASVSMQVNPVAFRYDGIWASKRPVHNAHDFADATARWGRYESTGSMLPPEIEWDNLWPRWEEYLRKSAK